MLAYVQAIGPIAQQGGDPSLILQVLAEAVQGRQKGQQLEVLLSTAFGQLAQRQQQAAADAQAAQGGAGGGPGGPPGGLPPGEGPSGLLQGVAPGQAGMQPGGRPSLQMMMASLGSSGKPNLTAGVRRNLPA